jgi:hypothetical protein
VKLTAITICAAIVCATPAAAQSRYAYAPGSAAIPLAPWEIHATLRSMHMRPVGRAGWLGRYIAQRAIDDDGSLVRVLLDPRYGGVVSIVPVAGAPVAGYRPYGAHPYRPYGAQPYRPYGEPPARVEPRYGAPPPDVRPEAAPPPAAAAPPASRSAALTPPRTPLPRPRPATAGDTAAAQVVPAPTARPSTAPAPAPEPMARPNPPPAEQPAAAPSAPPPAPANGFTPVPSFD